MTQVKSPDEKTESVSKPWECCMEIIWCTEDESCCECAGGHEFDPDEGGYCINERCEENGYEHGE